MNFSQEKGKPNFSRKSPIKSFLGGFLLPFLGILLFALLALFGTLFLFLTGQWPPHGPIYLPVGPKHLLILFLISWLFFHKGRKLFFEEIKTWVRYELSRWLSLGAWMYLFLVFFPIIAFFAQLSEKYLKIEMGSYSNMIRVFGEIEKDATGFMIHQFFLRLFEVIGPFFVSAFFEDLAHLYLPWRLLGGWGLFGSSLGFALIHLFSGVEPSLFSLLFFHFVTSLIQMANFLVTRSLLMSTILHASMNAGIFAFDEIEFEFRPPW